jgi:hypothetical protein
VTAASQFPSPTLSLATTPTTLGNIMTLAVGNNYQAFSSLITPSGGGVTTWNILEGYGDPTNECNAFLFWGEITSTGSQPLAVATFGSFVSGIAQEFNPSSTVSNDTMNGATSTNTSGNYPPVTPSGSDELYLATIFGDPTLGGSAAGFTYIPGAIPFGFVSPFQQMVYSIGPTGSTSPPWTSGATNYIPGRFLASGFLLGGSPPGQNNMQMIL